MSSEWALTLFIFCGLALIGARIINEIHRFKRK